MFGCYRRGDANDPDTYVAAVAMVLSRYAAEVVKAVTDPFSGLPSRLKGEYGGMPDVADVRAACDREAERLERYRSLGSRKPVPRIEGPPRMSRGNVLVPPTAPQVAGLLKRAEKADKGDWHHDPDRRGIWVPHHWMFESFSVEGGGFSSYSEAELRAMYPQPKAPGEDTAAA